MTMETERDRIASYNERTKLTAQAVQNLGLGVIGFAVVQPLVVGATTFSWRSAVGGPVGLAMLVLARYLVGRIIREKKA